MTTLQQLAWLDGYGLYVWGSYGLTLAALLAEALLLRARLRRARETEQTDHIPGNDTR